MTTTTPTYRTVRRPMPCPCGCGQRGICAEHKRFLARVREELFGDGGRYGMRSNQRGYRVPTCCSPECDNPRESPSPYCAGCLESSE